MKIELLINKEMTICVGQYAGCPTYTHELGHTPKSAPFYRKLKFDEEIIVEPNCDPSNHFFRQEHYRNGRFLNLLLEKFNIIFNYISPLSKVGGSEK